MISVEIYGEPVRTLPDPLRLATFEQIVLYDFVHDAPFEEGWYEYLSAEAWVSVQFPGNECVYEVIVIGYHLAEINELYRRLISGTILPDRR